MLADRYNAMDEDDKQDWGEYRRDLRYMPSHISNQEPDGTVDIEWPIKP